MKRGFLFIVGAAVLFLLGNAHGETFDTFRGIRWGVDLKSLSGLVAGAKKENVEVYTREEAKSVGTIEVENIYYLFHRGKFGAAIIVFRGAKNSSLLEQTLHEKYGPSQRPDPSVQKMIWNLKDLKIIFQYGQKGESGSIEYFFKPIVQQREEEKRKAGEQEIQKRMDDL